MKKRLKILSVLSVCFIFFLIIYFPGKQLPIARSLATGIGSTKLQDQIDRCEEKAILKESFEEEEIEFITDLCTCLYKGARLLIVLPEVSTMMEHHLGKSGEPLFVDPSIFNTNSKAIGVMNEIEEEIEKSDQLLSSYKSDTFYMPDASNIDSVFGLYYGYIEAKPQKIQNNIHIDWYAKVPWEWPSYDFLKDEYGDPHAESFPIPNFSCIFLGLEGAIYIDNGLGEYITQLGIAKSFKVYSEWNKIL